MGFFDDKEDVIEFQLTQYGKYKLSKGKFRPVYYAFFDDEVLYDGLYANVTESQNDIQDRIKDNTPQTKTQYVFDGIETNIVKQREYKNVSNDFIVGLQTTADNHYSVVNALGTVNPETSNAPAYDVRFLKGNLSSSIDYITGSNQTVRIPQLNSDIEYEISIGREEDVDENKFDVNGIESQERDFDRFATKFDDGTYIRIKEDDIILVIDEKNSPFEVKNFDIEVFEVETETDPKLSSGADPKENLIPLKFKTPVELVKNDILQDASFIDDEEEITEENVEYYFNINVDHEINKKELCDALKALPEKQKDLFADIIIDCPEIEERNRDKIYTSQLDEFEECDE